VANVTITQLPAAGPITGTESVPIVQNGQTVQTTTAAIAASPSQTQTFLTLNNEPTLANSRYLSTGTGLGLSDGGAQSDLEIILNGASGSLEAAGNGVIVKTGGTTVAARTITTSGAGLTITNGNGVSGNPTIALSGLAASLANMGGTGILGVVGGASITSMVITGTTNQIDVANGAGPGNPTLSISTNPVLPGTGAVTIPKGTTAQRPGGVDGMIRFNTETSAYETYDTSGGWSTLPSGAVTFVGTGTGLTGGPITSSGTISIANTGVTANTYGAAGAVARFTVNAQGQLTAAQTIPISIDPSQIDPGILPPGVTVPLAQSSVNIEDGLALEIPFQTAPSTTSFIAAPTVANTFLEWDGADFVWSTNPLGTVTSVDVSGASTGLTFTGGPITTSGTINLGGILNAVHGGTGFDNYTNGQLLIGSSITGNLGRATLTGTTNRLLVTNGDASITLNVDATSTNTADKVVARDASGNFSAGTITADLTGTASTATNLAGGAAGSIPYQTASGVTAMLATASGVLVGGTTPSYSTAPSLTGTNFTSIPNAALDNSSVTIGTTTISLGSSSLTLGGLTSVAVTQDPSNALDLATKQYVDTLVVSGVHFHAPVRVESPTPLTATYDNGVSGVGATLTNAGTQVALVIDGVTLSLNDRVLIYTQTNAVENGIYYVSDTGSISTDWELTRATDADSYGLASPDTLGEGSTVFVQEGNTGAGELYTCNTTGTITFGTTAITFVQISSAQIYSAGTGLTLSGTQFSVTTNGITDALFRQSAGLSVVGRSANSTGDVADITAASDHQVLRRSGTSIAFGAVSLDQATAVTGTLPTGNGGTGITGYAVGDLIYANTTTTLDRLTIGAASRILTSSGSAPAWTDPASVTVGSATNVAGGGAGQIVYNTASSTTTFLALGSSTFLLRAGASAPEYVDPANVSVGTATNVAGGGAGQLVYNTASGTTTFLALGTSGYILTAGASAPQYTDPATVSVGTATNSTNVAVTATSTNATFYPAFVDATTGNQAIEVDTDLTYNPSTNTLTVPNLVATSGISGGTF
jgi:hypothetical protein